MKILNCSLAANTSAGDLNVEMKQVGKYLKLNASSGNIRLDLPLKQGLDLDLHADNVSQHPTTVSNFTGDWDKHHVSGSVNGGGAQVSAHASSGDINVKFN